MTSLLAIAAPFALILPMFGQATTMVQANGAQAATGDKVVEAEQTTAPTTATDREMPSERPVIATPLDAFHSGQVLRQFRIQQRVIIRISPQRGGPRNDLLARLPRQGLNTQFEEREMDRCLRVDRISGVQTGTGNRLLLFLSDQRIVSLNLERACRARDFYSGFYIEQNDDGQLCVDRDELQSRSGARCEVERMRRLVAVEE